MQILVGLTPEDDQEKVPIITIFHRLTTVANHSKIIVLLHGQVAEMDIPGFKLYRVYEGFRLILGKSS